MIRDVSYFFRQLSQWLELLTLGLTSWYEHWSARPWFTTIQHVITEARHRITLEVEKKRQLVSRYTLKSGEKLSLKSKLKGGEAAEHVCICIDTLSKGNNTLSSSDLLSPYLAGRLAQARNDVKVCLLLVLIMTWNYFFSYFLFVKVTRHLCFKNSKNLQLVDVQACN